MAKILIRKQDPQNEPGFDEQLWPVYAAIVVLGGYLIGVICALCGPDDPWYRNRTTLLLALPFLIGGSLWLVRQIDNRFLRRVLQFSAVLSIIIHLSIILAAYLWRMMPVEEKQVAREDQREQKKVQARANPIQNPVTIRLENERPRRDFEKPVETKTPEPNNQATVERATNPQVELAEPRPQPQPVPNPEQTVKASIEKRAESGQTAPRQSEQLSKLSRNLARPDVRQTPSTISAPDANKPESKPAEQVAGQNTPIERKVTQPAKVELPTIENQPATTNPQPLAQIARRTTDPVRTPEPTAAPTLERKLVQPTMVPRTLSPIAKETATPKQTDPAEPKAAVVAATKAETPAPDVEKSTSEPNPQSSTVVKQDTPSRQEAKTPAIAQAQPVANAQASRSNPNAPPRPQQTLAAPQVASSARSSDAKVEARSVTTERAVTKVEVQAPTPVPQVAVTTPNPQAITPRPNAESPPQPMKVEAAPAVASRATSNPRVPSATVAATATPQTTNSNTPGVDAQGVSASKVAATSPEHRQSASTPSAPTPQAVAAAATPRQATADSKVPSPVSAPQINRQIASSRTVDSAIAAPQASTEAATKPTTLAAQATAATKSPTQIQVAARDDPTAPAPQATTPNVSPAMTIARQQAAPSANPAPQATPSPTPSRSVASLSPSPASRIESPAAGSPTPVANATQPGPSNVAAGRQASASAAPSSQVASPSESVPVSVSPQTVARQQSANPAPTMSASLTPAPNAARNPTTVRPSPSSIAAADASPTRTPNPTEGSVPRAAAADASRNPAPATAAIGSALPQTTPASSPDTQVARAIDARAQASTSPTTNPTSAPTANPSRSLQTGAVATSPRAIESPALAESSRPSDNPTAEPARLSLSRSSVGTAGLGADRNLDRGLPAPTTSNAPIASAAARRAEATQNTPAGPALSPAEVAKVSRSRADATSPQSTLQVQIASTAPMGGAEQPSELSASSSASINRNSANAKPGEISAAAGNLELDTGSTQIVASTGGGRAAGGGQPVINLETQSKALARNQAGGVPQVSLAAANPGAVQAPAGTGGGLPPSIDASQTSASLVKSQAGGSAPLSGGPAPAAATGPPAEAGQGDIAAALEVSRTPAVDSQPAIPAAGGGTNSPTRSATGQALVLSTQAQVPMLTGGPSATGAPTQAGAGGAGPMIEAQGGAASVARAEGGGVPALGGVSVAPEIGAPAETRSIAATGGRTESTGPEQSAPGGGATAAPLTRSQGAPSLAANTRAETIASGAPNPSAGGAAGAPMIEAGSVAVARAEAGGGQPVTGGLASKEDEEVGPVAPNPGGDVIASLEGGRAEATESKVGIPQAGGGPAGAPARAVSTQGFAANTQAEKIQLAGGPSPGGAPASAGNPAGVPLDANGVAQGRGAAALAGPSSDLPEGSEAGPVPFDAPSGGKVGAAIGQRGGSSRSGEGPAPISVADAGAPLRRAAVGGIPASGPIAPIAIPAPPAGTPGGRSDTPADMAQLAGAVNGGSPAKASGGAVPIAIEAPTGPGGLATNVTPDVGVTARQAQRESHSLNFTQARFVRQQSGGTPSFNSTAVVPTEAFAARRNSGLRRGDSESGRAGRPPRPTEDAIELGLAWIARHQMPDGSWSLTNFHTGRPGYPNERTAQLSSDTAATGLSLLCFFGAGYHHRDDRYQENIRRGLEWMLQHQSEDGNLYVSQDEESNKAAALYSHGIGTIALCEAYGMTQDPRLKDAAQKAIDFIVKAQHADRGGWRYSPGIGADTSVSGWMVMALKSGQLAGLKVPEPTYQKVSKWLDLAKGGRGQEHLFKYNPFAADTEAQRHGLQVSKTMTAVGSLMRMYLGRNRDHAEMKASADFLLQNLPAIGDPNNPQRDTYYWYYATQVMFHMKGDYWKRWNETLHPMLVQTQEKEGPAAGSWNPVGSVPDRWGYFGGRLYVTTMNILSLEVTYRHLPIYEETAK